jgi:hypothetical protein
MCGLKQMKEHCNITTFVQQTPRYHSINRDSRSLLLNGFNQAHTHIQTICVCLNLLYWSGYFKLIISLAKLTNPTTGETKKQTNPELPGCSISILLFLPFPYQRGFPPAKNVDSGDGEGFLSCFFFRTSSNSVS